jgi:hypothetical protein
MDFFTKYNVLKNYKTLGVNKKKAIQALFDND